MAKSSMARVVAVSRQVNELDARGKLIIMKDLQSQGLEKSTKATAEKALVELLEAVGGKVVDVTTYKEGKGVSHDNDNLGRA